MSMTEYEWDAPRVPRARLPRSPDSLRPETSPVAEYVALEFPRESVTWLLAPRSRGDAAIRRL